jgi:hypothetical protein
MIAPTRLMRRVKHFQDRIIEHIVNAVAAPLDVAASEDLKQQFASGYGCVLLQIHVG